MGKLKDNFDTFTLSSFQMGMNLLERLCKNNKVIIENKNIKIIDSDTNESIEFCLEKESNLVKALEEQNKDMDVKIIIKNNKTNEEEVYEEFKSNAVVYEWIKDKEIIRRFTFVERKED